jgi:cell division protein FtsN
MTTVKEEDNISKQSNTVSNNYETREEVLIIDNNSTANRYYVILGSFSVINYANKYSEQLIKEGFTPNILQNNNGLFRISILSTNNIKEARDLISEIKLKYPKHQDVWLLKRIN